MKCPVCKKEMVVENFGGAKVDVCKDGCKGIWFDWFELSKLDETHEGAGQALEGALNHPRANDENREKINCPKCGIPMHIHKYKSSKEVNVDECYGCAGFFLDSGELRTIRDNFMSEEGKEAYVQSLLKDIPEYQEMKATIDEQKEKNETRKKAVSKFKGVLSGGFWK